MDVIIEDYINNHSLRSVQQAELYDQARWFGTKNHVFMQPWITPVVLVDPVTRQIGQSMENGTQRVTHRDPFEISSTVPADNADPTYTVPPGEYKKIYQIIAYLAATGVANREFGLTINQYLQSPGAATPIMTTATITVTDAQYGIVSMLPNGPTWLNDNGTITNEDTNVAGTLLMPQSTIVPTWTNKDPDDRAELQVWMVDYPNAEVV